MPTTTRPTAPTGLSGSDRAFAAAIIAAFAAGGTLWLGAVCCAWLAGSPAPRNVATSLARLLRHPGDPSAAWGEHLPAAGWYWTVTAVIAALIAALAITVFVLARRLSTRTARDPRTLPGLATRAEITQAAGRKAVLRRAAIIRPSLPKPAPRQVGYRVGRAAGRDVWISAEDSVIILGPPRAGKGLHLVIPMILDAPGPVVTTSTRPDNLTATLTTRQRRGPVAVFDPQHLAPESQATLRWSPIRGCEHPQTAMIRARALAAGTGRGLEAGDFWQAQVEAVLRGFLHAAALDGRAPVDLYRWSLSPAAAGDATRILTTSPRAADGWADALDAATAADPRTRDSIWIGLRTALGCLADPRVLDAISPRAGDHVEPAEFLRDDGTVYLLGTSAGAGAAANLIGAYIEDIAETARRTAANSPGHRLDPPLALILDEIANYPLPSLPALMSEGGGSGITTIAVLQSLAQARAKWGDHNGTAIWDAAIAKIILGGGTTTRDLTDLSALIGTHDDDAVTENWDSHGRRSTSRAQRRVPIMDTSRLRTLPFGTGVLILRTAPPVLLNLTPWIARTGIGRHLAVRVADGHPSL